VVTITPYPLSTLPAPYDVVWCRFPEHESLGTPAPKARPALVKNVASTPDGRGEVQLVYGTTNLKMNIRQDDFFVTNSAEMDACGLYRATRFDLDNIAWIPWAQEWFDVLPEYTSPIIGHLSQHGIKMLQLTASYKQAKLLAFKAE
jgi:hypothetical protein